MPVVIINGIPAQLSHMDMMILPHPLHENKSSIFLETNGDLFEIQKIKQGNSSWFVDSSVVSDGSLLIASKIDPLFIILPLLERCRESTPCFVALDQLGDAEDAIVVEKLFSKFDLQMDTICDSQIVEDMKLYRLNDERILKWLLHKVQRLQTVLETTKPQTSALYHKNTIVEAIKLLCEYLPSKWAHPLLEHFSLPSNALESKPVLSRDDRTLADDVKPVSDKPGASTKAKSGRAIKKSKLNPGATRSLKHYFGSKS